MSDTIVAAFMSGGIGLLGAFLGIVASSLKDQRKEKKEKIELLRTAVILLKQIKKPLSDIVDKKDRLKLIDTVAASCYQRTDDNLLSLAKIEDNVFILKNKVEVLIFMIKQYECIGSLLISHLRTDVVETLLYHSLLLDNLRTQLLSHTEGVNECIEIYKEICLLFYDTKPLQLVELEQEQKAVMLGVVGMGVKATEENCTRICGGLLQEGDKLTESLERLLESENQKFEHIQPFGHI